MILSIVTGKKNKILRAKSEKVGDVGSDVLGLIKNMKETLAASEHGIGLAAPQVGKNLRIFVIDEEVAQDGKTVFINPEITKVSKKKAVLEEGCLSIPDQWHELERAEKATIKAVDDEGKKFKLRAKGLLARLVVHEVDHLNGILFVDHL